MKKIISILLVGIMMLGMISCASTPAATTQPSTTPTETNDPTQTGEETVAPSGIDFKIFAMKGPTGMGMAKLISDMEKDGPFSKEYSYSITLADNVNEKLSALIGGEFDIAAVPTNFAASVLNNKASGMYSIVAVNTLGVLYILDNDGSVKTAADLKGKTIYATGAGTVPQFVLEYVLTKSGLEIGKDVQVEYLESASDVGKLLESDKAAVAMLPQPYVTTLLNKSESINVALDLTAEWDRLSNGESRLMTGCIVVKNTVLDSCPDLVEKFLKDYKESVEFVNNGTDAAAQAVVDAGIVGALPVAKKAIPKCNIVYITGEEMKKDLTGFYNALYSINPQSVGGKVPGDELYHN